MARHQFDRQFKVNAVKPCSGRHHCGAGSVSRLFFMFQGPVVEWVPSAPPTSCGLC